MTLLGTLSGLMPGAYRRSNPRIDVDGAVVIVTGAGRGIGERTAARFAAGGAVVWLTDVDAEVAAAAAREIPGARSAPLDVTDRAQWRAVVDEILAVDGRIDVLVNNAGVMPVGPYLEETASTTDLILDVNAAGVLYGMRAVLPTMIGARRGHIVTVSSMAGMLPLPGMITYNASKYAALGASLAARREFDGTGVTVSTVLPAAVRTELSSGADLGGTLPTVDPDDVARAVLRTLATRAARTSVPGWVARGWALVDLAVPESVERVVRDLAGHRQALSLDADARAAYSARIARHAAQHAAQQAAASTGSQRLNTGSQR